jgi:hypothetical protein
VNGSSVDVDSAFGSLHCVDAGSVSNMLTYWIYMLLCLQDWSRVSHFMQVLNQQTHRVNDRAGSHFSWYSEQDNDN